MRELQPVVVVQPDGPVVLPVLDDQLERSTAKDYLVWQAVYRSGPLSVAAQVPMTYAERGDLSGLPPSSRGPSTLLGGFGDLRITPRLALLRQEWSGIDLATQVSLEVPTARSQTLTDDGRVRVEGLVALGRRLGDQPRAGPAGARESFRTMDGTGRAQRI